MTKGKRPLPHSAGLSAFPFAFRLIRKTRSLWKWALPPMILSFLLALFGFSWTRTWLDSWLLGSIGSTLAKVFSAHPGIHSFLISALHVFSFGITAVAFTFLFSWAYILLAIPFSDPLAEATERVLGIPPSFGGNGKPVSFGRMFWVNLQKSCLVIFLQVVVFGFSLLFFWLPGIEILLFAMNAWLIAFQFLSYPQTRRGLGVLASFRVLGRRPWIVWSFGALIATVYFIPYLSSFLTPIAVVAGTILYARIERSTVENEESLRGPTE